MIGIAVKTGTAVIVADLARGMLREDIKAAIHNEGIQSFAHFPIVVDGKVIAIFNVAYTRPNALTKDSTRLFTALVNRAALSIANMELFEQTKGPGGDGGTQPPRPGTCTTAPSKRRLPPSPSLEPSTA
ncbi:MAG: GAF domain-containing protein [Chloroflexi bacterium]|nr:GAF domain-containing protein [Chloroflexota bacterium]